MVSSVDRSRATWSHLAYVMNSPFGTSQVALSLFNRVQVPNEFPTVTVDGKDISTSFTITSMKLTERLTYDARASVIADIRIPN